MTRWTRIAAIAAVLVLAAAGATQKNKDAEIPKRTLELNPSHPLIRDLRALVEKDADDPFVGLATEQMFEGALLADGYLADPHRLVARMNEVLTEAARSKAGDGSS